VAVTFQLTSDGRTSHIEVGRDLLSSYALPARPDRSLVVVLHQPGSRHIAERIGASLAAGYDVHSLGLPDRDQAKAWSEVASLYEWLASTGLGRNDTIVGVGGGALTDVAGFVAATWLRGVESAYVPTTLLGAVDAAIGGKTGINVAGKNLVGAFWHPASVVIDLGVLEALPVALKREGFAEVVKAGFIADPTIVEAFLRDGVDVALEDVVTPAVKVKVDVVSEDYREVGRRAILNFGHTIGHAIEFSSGMSHGDAVAVGMVAAGAISEARYGCALPIRAALERLGLPVSAHGRADEFLELVRLDKKRDSGGVRMVLLTDLGAPVVDHVSTDELRIGLSAIGVAS